MWSLDTARGDSWRLIVPSCSESPRLRFGGSCSEATLWRRGASEPFSTPNGWEKLNTAKSDITGFATPHPDPTESYACLRRLAKFLIKVPGRLRSPLAKESSGPAVAFAITTGALGVVAGRAFRVRQAGA